MAEKKTMGKAKSNCVAKCSICGGTISAGAKYGIMDNQIYCPVCHNLWLMREQADIRYIRQKRIKRTIIRTSCFLLFMAFLIVSLLLKEEATDLQFTLAIICSVVVACFPFYKNFIAFFSKGFYGFLKDESTVQRNSPVYFKNGIIDDGGIGVVRLVYYLIDFVLAFVAVALLVIAVLPRAIIDLVRIKKAKTRIENNYDQLLPPYDGNDSTKYDFDLVFKDSYSYICVDYYAYHYHVSKKKAEEELEKNLVVPLVHDATYFEGYKAFLPFYDGRRNRNGERYILFEVKLNPKSLENGKKVTCKKKNR